MATFTIHRVNVFIPGGNCWTDDSDYYNPVHHCDDIENTCIIFGHEAAWNFYRKEIQRLREYYDTWSVTIESALVPENGLISGRKLGFYPGDGCESLKELKWELLDTTSKNMRGI
jgi:hypothetical protein